MADDTDWQPGRWWRVVDAQGELWAETSSESDARNRMRPGDTLLRLWERNEAEWRVA